MFKVGTVTHYYDKIGVAVITLSGTLSVGEKVKFVCDGEHLFEQVVESIQVEHNKLGSAKSGDVIGIKTEKEVKEGTDVFKI